MILIFLVFQITYETCTQLNYQDCMEKTQNDSCIYSKESLKCFASSQDYLGCVTNINRKLCLLQNINFKCKKSNLTPIGQYNDKCRSIEQSTLEKIGCEWRELNKKACVSITSDRCIWVQEELKCKQYLSSPSAEERCETQYNDKGQFLIVSPLQCSQIQFMACIWNPSNFICASEIPKDSRCDDLGLSKLACIQLQTLGQKCIYSKQNKFCQDDQVCSMICQHNFLDECNQNMNQNACLGVQSEACQFLDGVCQKIIPAQCKNQLVNAKTCSEVEQEICIYDINKLSCETPSFLFLSCDSQGINKLACIQLSNQCIFDTKCRTIDPSELLFIQCADAVSKSTCLSIKTEFQNCQWNADLIKCQEIQITKQTSCTFLKSVNGNACKAVIKDSCKYQKENCINADVQDSCDANFINIIGCTSILKLQTACKWLNNQCQKISIHADQTCESLSLVNPVACSLYYKQLEDKSFSCIMSDNFKWFDYTCRYDSLIMGCRTLLQKESSMLVCGDKKLGLNSYACSLITTPGQVCIFRGSQCIASNPLEQYQIQCGVIQFGNPSSCSYTIFGNQPCKFNLNKCGCIQSIDPKNDGCQTYGVNAIGCSMIKKEQCYYETKNYFECKPKLNPEQSNQISCEQNFPNKELCLAILKSGEKCEWSIIDQKCKNKQVDPGQPCSYYNQVNQNVCTYIQQIEPNQNNKGYCYYDPLNHTCKSWEIGRKCSQSCCIDQIGINIHVCSAMTNADNSFCYFKDQICKKYEITNQLDLERISVIFGDDDQCEQFNYQMCGLINPSLEKLYYCYQPSNTDRCHTLLTNVYKQMDKTLLLADNIRSNLWTCTNINQVGVRVRYDQTIGKCVSLPITQTIRCEEYLVNKQACLELTRVSTCYWDEINFRCKEINFNTITCQSIINKNSCLNLPNCRFNNILLQCEDMQTIDSSVKCSSLKQDYSYNSNACQQVTDGTSCAYDSINQSCKQQTDTVSDCFLFGQNRQSCLSNTQGLCKWDDTQKLCIQAIINSECDPDFNKYSCMKVTEQKCSFDTQCNTITQIFTCDQLVEQSQILSRYFNQLTCTSIIQDGQLCGYDIKNFKCQNKFLDANNKTMQNFKCTQFPMNIHLCLSYTQGSYCYYNTTASQCSDYILTEPFQNCSTTNLNRDVCINSAASCKYNKQKSKCEDFKYNNEKCTDLKATTDYLFGVVACTSVSNPKQTETKDYYKVCHAFQCDLQLFCTADPITQGCDIIQYVFPSNDVVDGQQICTDVKKYLTCNKLYSKFTCIYLTDVPCYFDPIKKVCQDLDATNQNEATCNSVSAAGCQQVLTKGEFCFVKTVQFQPVACNVGLPTYQICSYITEASPIPYYIKDVTYYYYYTQCQYYLNYNIQVNPNTCGQLQSCKVIYDEDTGQCTEINYVTGCDVPGMSKLLCDANSNQGCDYDSSLKYCYKKSSITSANCENTKLYTTEFSDSSKFNTQAIECPKNPNCAYILTSLFYYQTQIYNDLAACNNCASTAQTTKTTDDSSCNTAFASCSNIALTNGNQCDGCEAQNGTKEVTINNTIQQVTPVCTNGDHSYFNKNCTCTKNKCLQESLDKYNTATQSCSSKSECQKYIQPCKTYTKITNAASLIQTYQTMPKDLCLLSTEVTVGFDSQNYICNTVSSTQTKCSNLNYDSCVTLTNAKNLYCAWINNQCRKINSYQFNSLTDCTLVNTNSCFNIKANCYISSSRCRSQTNLGSCADPNAKITSQFTCSQLESNQCYFKSDQVQCVQIVGNDYLYDCKMPGLNKNACLINTNQYCYYNKECLQISELSNQKCPGLNRKGCIEHPLLPCIWDYSTSTCSQVVYSSNPTCTNFQTTMPSSYLVNLITCLQILNYPCVYLNNLCQTPLTQSGCTAQLYNKLGCTQSTNQLCQFKIGKTYKIDQLTIIQQIYCYEIGDLNQRCDETLNQLACVKMVGCIWQSVCKDFVFISDSDAQTQLSTYSISPQICQNIQGQPYTYNNYKCQIANSLIYDCTPPYINYDTCVQFTKGYCIFNLPTVITYTDTTQRCLNYDISQLNTQLCDQQLNFNVCSAVYNSACVFKQNKCQQFNKLEDTCISLSQPGIYASVQSCVQTSDSFCSYDSINQRCKVITSASTIICNQLGINQKLCLSITKLSNKCEFQTTSIPGTELTNSRCVFATKDFYQCDSLVSMNQCVLIQNCKFQDYKCQLLQSNDYTNCLKSYQVDGLSCSQATDIACGYDESNYTCIQNPIDDIKKIKYLNKLACVQSKLTESLIFLDNQCQLVKDSGVDTSNLKCDQDLNQFACLNIDQSSDQLCIFSNKCQVAQNSKCLQNKNINNPQICQNTDDVPCKFLNNNCVNAANIESECQSKGLNILACLQTNLLTCQACADIILNSQCAQVDTQVLCLSLNHECQWITNQQGQPNQCLIYDTTNKKCDQLPAGVNRHSCYSINMNSLIDQECVYDISTTKCKQQTVTSCQNLNSQVTCISNNLLQCIWQKNKCQASTPLKGQDYCTTFLGSNEFCKAVERFDANCEFIQGECTEAQYSQVNWDKYVNKKACIQQKLRNCYWKINSCICIHGEELLKQQQLLQCEQDLSYLMCLSITTQGEYCQFLYGKCNQLVLPQTFEWNRYSLVSQNVCAQVSRQYVGYNKIKFSCQILSKVDDCDYPGLNKQICLSQILDQPCIWLNNKCQYQVGKGKSRLLQQNQVFINSAICYDSILAVYYDGVQCQQVNELTKCDALGLSKAGCLTITSEPCRWFSDNEGCIKDYPYNRCEQNVGMVNAVFCQYVELGACKYEQKTNSCVSAYFDTWVYHYQQQKCECIANYCDQSKIEEQCILPSTKGINDKACILIEGAIYMNHECQLINPNSKCPKLIPVNPLACRYAIDDCIYDSIDENCTSVNFGQSCEDRTISQVACQSLQCSYFDNVCTCKSLQEVYCLTYNQQICESNNLCYWEDLKCHINQCKGKTDNCDTDQTQNCYRRMKNEKQICDYANTCEDIKFDTSFYQGCTQIKINGVPCLSNQDKNSLSACSTLQCSNFKSSIDCIQTSNGMINRSDYCVYVKDQCSPIQCSDKYSQDECNSKIGCRYIYIDATKQICQEFKTCADVKDLRQSVEEVCNKMVELDNLGKNYIPCSWSNDKCVNNPCQYLGIDVQICNGAHIDNKYVCALDKNSYTCNACEVYQKGCDCLQNDKYCKWNTNKQICQSIPCKDIQGQETCKFRNDCQYSNVCFTKCQYHYNQQFCQENQCYWDSYYQKCAECDINFCDDSTCSNQKCCYNKKIVEYGETYFVCVPICEKIVSSQCESKFCSWRVDIETCLDDYKTLEVQNENSNQN